MQHCSVCASRPNEAKRYDAVADAAARRDRDAQALAAALSLPSGEAAALVIALGHCADVAPQRLRKPLD